MSTLVGVLQLQANERASSTTLSCGEGQQRSRGRKFKRGGNFSLAYAVTSKDASAESYDQNIPTLVAHLSLYRASM